MLRTIARLLALASFGLLPACLSTVEPRTPAQLARDGVEAIESGEQFEDPPTSSTAVRGTALLRVLSLRAQLDPSDREHADDWIAGHVTMFAGPLHRARSRANVVPSPGTAAMADATLRKAEKGFVAWERETRYDAIEPDFARVLFLLPPRALADLDRFALGLQTLERASHDPESQAALTRARATFAIYCGRSRGMADRLVAWLASRHDPRLVQGLFDAMLARDEHELCAHPRWSTARPLGEVLQLWTASVWWPEVWNEVTRALTRSGIDLGDGRALSLLHQAWLTWPERRGALLALIGNAAAPARTFRGFGAGRLFEQTIGPRPTRKDLAAMLARGPETLAALPQIVNAMDEKVSARSVRAELRETGLDHGLTPADIARIGRAVDAQEPRLPPLPHEC